MSAIQHAFDTSLLEQARRVAQETLSVDPELSTAAHAELRRRVLEYWSRSDADLTFA